MARSLWAAARPRRAAVVRGGWRHAVQHIEGICSARSGPRSHRARSRCGVHWRTQSHRPVVPERSRRCHERLHGHARQSGALSATSPAELLLDWSGGWRGLFGILAAVTAVSALMIWFVVPEATSAKPSSNEHAPVSLKIIYSDPRFWELAPLSATCAGTAWALQGLWATPWLTDVDGLPQADVTRHLLIMAIVQGIAALLLGAAADRLRRRGVGPQVLLGFIATTLIAAQLALSSHRCRQRQYASGAANPRSPCGSEPRCRRGTADRRANQDRPWWRSGLCAAQFPQAPCR